MNLCPLCGRLIVGRCPMCNYHTATHDGWATGQPTPAPLLEVA